MMQMILALSVLVIATIAALGYLAATGSAAAAFALGMLSTLAIQAINGLFELLRNRAQAQREQTAFVANAKENLAMMQSMQKIQNQQSAGLMQQLNSVNRLPAPVNSLLIESDVFSELD